MKYLLDTLRKEHSRLEAIAMKYFDVANYKASDKYQYQADGIMYTIKEICKELNR